MWRRFYLCRSWWRRCLEEGAAVALDEPEEQGIHDERDGGAAQHVGVGQVWNIRGGGGWEVEASHELLVVEDHLGLIPGQCDKSDVDESQTYLGKGRQAGP